ncbi:hypothetical protein D3C75_1219990 [compost metagenome]
MNLRSAIMPVIKMAPGNQTHSNSDMITACPAGVRYFSRLNGATRITCQGAKKRSSLHGHSQPTPLPPVVTESSKLWDNSEINRNNQVLTGLALNQR